LYFIAALTNQPTMQPIEEILKEFDEECEGRLLWDPEIPGRALDDDSVRAFIA